MSRGWTGWGRAGGSAATRGPTQIMPKADTEGRERGDKSKEGLYYKPRRKSCGEKKAVASLVPGLEETAPGFAWVPTGTCPKGWLWGGERGPGHGGIGGVAGRSSGPGAGGAPQDLHLLRARCPGLLRSPPVPFASPQPTWVPPAAGSPCEGGGAAPSLCKRQPRLCRAGQMLAKPGLAKRAGPVPRGAGGGELGHPRRKVPPGPAAGSRSATDASPPTPGCGARRDEPLEERSRGAATAAPPLGMLPRLPLGSGAPERAQSLASGRLRGVPSGLDGTPCPKRSRGTRGSLGGLWAPASPTRAASPLPKLAGEDSPAGAAPSCHCPKAQREVPGGSRAASAGLSGCSPRSPSPGGQLRLPPAASPSGSAPPGGPSPQPLCPSPAGPVPPGLRCGRARSQPGGRHRHLGAACALATGRPRRGGSPCWGGFPPPEFWLRFTCFGRGSPLHLRSPWAQPRGAAQRGESGGAQSPGAGFKGQLRSPSRGSPGGVFFPWGPSVPPFSFGSCRSPARRPQLRILSLLPLRLPLLSREEDATR